MKLSDLLAYDGDGRAQLLLDALRRAQHEIHDAGLDGVAVGGADLVIVVLALERMNHVNFKHNIIDYD